MCGLVEPFSRSRRRDATSGFRAGEGRSERRKKAGDDRNDEFDQRTLQTTISPKIRQNERMRRVNLTTFEQCRARAGGTPPPPPLLWCRSRGGAEGDEQKWNDDEDNQTTFAPSNGTKQGLKMIQDAPLMRRRTGIDVQQKGLMNNERYQL